MFPECGSYHDNCAVLAATARAFAGGVAEEGVRLALTLREHIRLTEDEKSKRWLMPEVERILDERREARDMAALTVSD